MQHSEQWAGTQLITGSLNFEFPDGALHYENCMFFHSKYTLLHSNYILFHLNCTLFHSNCVLFHSKWTLKELTPLLRMPVPCQLCAQLYVEAINPIKTCISCNCVTNIWDQMSLNYLFNYLVDHSWHWHNLFKREHEKRDNTPNRFVRIREDMSQWLAQHMDYNELAQHMEYNELALLSFGANIFIYME